MPVDKETSDAFEKLEQSDKKKNSESYQILATIHHIKITSYKEKNKM